MEFFLLVLSTSLIQAIGYVCSQEYSRLEGLSGDQLVQAFMKAGTLIRLYGIGSVLSCCKNCMAALKQEYSTLSKTGVFLWEIFFFRLFISLIGAYAFCLAFYSCAAFEESFPVLYVLRLHTERHLSCLALAIKHFLLTPLK